MNELLHRIGGLSRPKRALLVERNPLSFAQQRLWFLDQLEPGSHRYNMPLAVRLMGDLDVAALAGALAEIVRRHQVLRTLFPALDGRPLQLVVPCAAGDLPFQLVDLTSLPVAAREAEVDRLAAAEVRRPLRLASELPCRFALIALGQRRNLLLASLHHMVSDGWSFDVLVRELGALYSALSARDRAPCDVLPELPLQYLDYSRWQRRRLQGETLASLVEYWQRQLAGLPPLLELPTDRPRSPVQSYRGGSCSLTVAPATAQLLRGRARESGATLFMAVLAAWGVLLYRASGQDDFAVGTPMVNRDRVELEKLIGLFHNMLVLRVQIAGDPSFYRLLELVRETVLAAHAHQELPFERLVDELQPERAMGRQPLFQVMMTLRKPQERGTPLPGVQSEMVQVAKQAAKFDLTLFLIERDDRLEAQLEYSTDLFSEATAARLLQHYTTLLAEAAAEPEAGIGALRLLSLPERAQLLSEWNEAGTAGLQEPAACVHQLFEEQAARFPDRPAAACEGAEITYSELDRRAARLAGRLRALGIGPEDRVGVHLQRSVDMLVALLGVLKAGGAYVPLDPAFPRERLDLMIEDASVAVLLTDRRLAAELAVPEHVRILALDIGGEGAARHSESDDSSVRPADLDQLAYVIYTSGSTGRPKGVQVPHRGVVSFLRYMARELGLTGRDRLLALTTLSFDISVLELFLPLALGARVEIVGRETAVDGAALAARLADARTTVMQATPATWQMLVETGWRSSAGLKMLCGGEALPAVLAARLTAGGGELWNVYGPTETTIWSTLQRVPPSAASSAAGEAATVSIGRPVAGTTVHLLARHTEREPVPIGFPGELCIGGVGVTRGYLGRPELTAERFVPDPFGALRGEPGTRLYRTGDLARRRPDGVLEFLGRVDHQVKVRGFRVEPGEIEARLLAHPRVREAVVVARRDSAGHGVLVAYLVAADGAGPTVPELRSWLRAMLPDYMVPSAFVPLATLPLTPNGKVDRLRLPLPEPARTAGDGEPAAPRTPTEEVVAGVFSEVLRCERIGVYDEFFELGGHSLLATQVVSRLRESFGLDLPLRSLFEHPTAAGLADVVDGALQAGRGLQMPPLVAEARAGDPPLSFAQQRLWLLDRLEPGNPFYNLSTAVRLSGPLDAAAMAAALTEIVRRHEALRTSFLLAGDLPVQRIAPPALVPLPLSDLSALPGVALDAELERLLREATDHPFDLAQGPVLRARLLRLGETEHALAITVHHIAGDRWSMGLLVNELTVLYRAGVEGRPLAGALPELPIQYADFALWQRRWLEGGALERQLAYWRRQLAGSPPLLELPTDRPRPTAPGHRGARHPFTLPPPLADALRRLSRTEGVTLSMTLLAGFAALLGWVAGREDVVLGSNVAARNHSRTEKLIGFFANLLVLRTDLAGDPNFRELLARVREVALGAYAHQDVPFDKLVEDLQPKRDASYPPLVQVVFSFQNVPVTAPAFGPLAVRPLPARRATAKFDLVLDLSERNGGLHGTLEYSTELFAAETAARLAAQYAALLQAVAARPEMTLGEIQSTLAEAERQRRTAAASRFESEDARALARLRRGGLRRAGAAGE